jgi:diaminopimelate epimerase
MKAINFSKLNGQGNDFVIIEDICNAIHFSKEEIIKICNRKFGIGADGLILIKPSRVSDFKMDYYNSDGSVAEMCGNGIRCMARFIYENNLSKLNLFNIETLSGIKNIILDIANKKLLSVEVNMGHPYFETKKIPVNVEKESSELLEYPIDADDRSFMINCVSMGNPHCVIILENEDLDDFDLPKYGSIIENHKIFPQNTNVEFIKILKDNEIAMRVWERGVGETLACGTGACASAVICQKLKKISANDVKVNLPGGVLKIFWDKNNNNVFLKGSVSHVFDGKYYY